MADNRDHYEAYYADKLWNLLPAVYRTEDTDVFDRAGPLRELVNRIGAQAAILRRSIDRLWEDQSIETCDDWVIPYIADLLATNLVASLDARGQRLDVANTVYYRRRKGTVAILEEIAIDITGWDARIVELFRRLGRTRHSLDPEIGMPSATPDPAGNRTLQMAQGLIGPLTQTGIGGWADLRRAYGAAKAHSAFDEFFHTADCRRGRGQVGWHSIPRLGVFLWRLQSVGVDQTTPVAVQNCPGHYTFDPTGRKIQLFAVGGARAYGGQWAPPPEQQLPTPISKALLKLEIAQLYPNSMAVLQRQESSFDPLDADKVTLYPEIGRFLVDSSFPNDTLRVRYHYGFSSTIGAGPYDRLSGKKPVSPPEPVHSVSGGKDTLASPLATLAPIGTVTLQDSLTYTSVSDVGTSTAGIQQVVLKADNKIRPVLRLPEPAPAVAQWVFTGADGGQLTLDGLFISGGDIILRGNFATVTLSCCTLDPGNSGASEKPPAEYAKALDGRDLLPCHLWVEGRVGQLSIERCIVGPIATRGSAGKIETLIITDSIIQALGTELALTLTDGAAELTRCTLLGPARLHRLNASECIFDDVVQVEDAQHGCVRFSAWATGSILPRQYESVRIAPQAPLFSTRLFGQPDYAQLLSSADAAVLAPPGATLSEGAQDGSEMGAFAREKNPIKERSLQIKLEEFMPLGLIPVFVYVT